MAHLPAPKFGIHLECKLVRGTEAAHHLRRTENYRSGIFQNLFPSLSGLYSMVEGKGAGSVSFVRPETGNFIKGKMPAGWCALKYHQSDFTLALSFPVETVPYMSVLPNEGGWRDIHNIFLEPATASFDRLDIARKHREFSTVGAHSTYEWHLNFTLANTTEFQAVGKDGKLI